MTKIDNFFTDGTLFKDLYTNICRNYHFIFPKARFPANPYKNHYWRSSLSCLWDHLGPSFEEVIGFSFFLTHISFFAKHALSKF